MSRQNYIETRRNDPPCYICYQYLHTDNNRMFFRDKNVPGYDAVEWEYKKSYHCTATVLQSLQFDYPLVWSTFFRVIVYDLTPQSGWWLSGIAQFTKSNTHVCYVPRASSRAVCGRSSAANQKLEAIRISEFVVRAGIEAPPRAVYPIHMRCWELIRSRLGSSINTNLDLLVNVLRNEYQGHILAGRSSVSMWGASDPVLIRKYIHENRTSDPTNILTYGLHPDVPAWMHNMTATQWHQYFDNLDYDEITAHREQYGIPQGMQMQRYFRDRVQVSQIFFELLAYPVNALNWEYLCRTIERAHDKHYPLVTSRIQINPILNVIKTTYDGQYQTAHGTLPPP